MKIIKKVFAVLSVVVGVLAYSYMITGTAKGTGDGVSLTTFGLWAALAWITSFTMLKQKANPAVPMVYGIGATATAIILLTKGKCSWSQLDTLVAIMVVGCVCLWLISGPRWALIMSIAAAVVAAIPFIVMTWQAPEKSPIIPSTGFFLANIFAFISAKAWTVEDRLYSGVNIVVCSLLVVPYLPIVLARLVN